MQTDQDFTNALQNIRKTKMTRVLVAFENKQPGSAAEKLDQRGDLEAMINQLEDESHGRAKELLAAARQQLPT